MKKSNKPETLNQPKKELKPNNISEKLKIKKLRPKTLKRKQLLKLMPLNNNKKLKFKPKKKLKEEKRNDCDFLKTYNFDTKSSY